jgi:hypothetical protein
MSRPTVVFLLFTIFLGGPQLARAEWYAGAEATNLELRMSFEYGREYYDLSPARLNLGYLWDGVGVEFQAYSDANETINVQGLNLYIANEETVGAHLVWFADEINTKITAGAIRTKITNTLVDFDVTDEDVVVLIGLSASFVYNFTENFGLSAGYNYYEGKTDLPNTTVSGPGLSSRISTVLSGFSAGLQYRF